MELHEREILTGRRTGSETDPYRVSMEINKMNTGEQYVFSMDEYLTARHIFIVFVSTFAKGRNLEVEYYIPAEEDRCNLEQ